MENPELSEKLALLGQAKPTQSAVEYVVDAIKRLIVEGDLSPGEQLPSENELTHLLAVSRSSLREAKKILSALGLVEIRRGDGTYIRDNNDSAALDALLLSFALSKPSLKEIYDLRHVIEAGVMTMAIQNATESQIDELESYLKDMMKNAERHEAGAEKMGHLDVDFHRFLGHMTSNRLLEKIYSYIMNYLEASIIESHKKQDEMAGYAIKSHLLIIEVLRTRDSSRIEEVSKTTVDTWFNLVEDRYQSNV